MKAWQLFRSELFYRRTEPEVQFFADVPDLTLVCDGVRVAGNHVAYLWTFTGNHASSGRALRVSGWEEWDLDADYMVEASLAWFDAEDYARQTSGAIAEH